MLNWLNSSPGRQGTVPPGIDKKTSKLSFVKRGDERAEKTGACQEETGPSSQLVCKCSRPEERQVIISSLLEK